MRSKNEVGFVDGTFPQRWVGGTDPNEPPIQLHRYACEERLIYMDWMIRGRGLARNLTYVTELRNRGLTNRNIVLRYWAEAQLAIRKTMMLNFADTGWRS